MQLILGLVSYLVVVFALVGGAAMFLSGAAETTPSVMARGNPGDAAPRIQAWLDRKAEALVFAEKEKAAARAEAERVKALYARRTPSIAEQAEMVKEREGDARKPVEQERRSAERERAAEAKAKRDATRRAQQREALAAFGSAAAPAQAPVHRNSSYQDQRDRTGL